MEQICALPGNDGRHCEPLVFDPCQFLLDLDTITEDGRKYFGNREEQLKEYYANTSEKQIRNGASFALWLEKNCEEITD